MSVPCHGTRLYECSGIGHRLSWASNRYAHRYFFYSNYNNIAIYTNEFARAHTLRVCVFFFIHSFFSFVPCRLPAHAGDGGMHVCVRMWLYIKLWVQLISKRTTNRERKKNWWTIAQVLYIYSIIYILYVCVCLCELSHQCAINSACVCVCVQCIIIIV